MCVSYLFAVISNFQDLRGFCKINYTIRLYYNHIFQSDTADPPVIQSRLNCNYMTGKKYIRLLANPWRFMNIQPYTMTCTVEKPLHPSVNLPTLQSATFEMHEDSLMDVP